MFNITGSKVLSAFILKKDYKRILIWIAILVILSFYVAKSFPSLYPTDMDAKAIVDTLANPAMIAMLGPHYGDTNSFQMGAIFSAEMLLFTALAVAIMNILLITRHTRKDEEEGRLELIRSLPVGKSAILFSTLSVYTVVNIVMGFLIGISLALAGIESMNWSGSILYGMTLSATGILFATTTSVFSQLTQTTRGTLGYSFSFLGFTYLLRAIGDINSEALSLISPLGLIMRTKTYVENVWWPILIVLALSVIIGYIAFRLNNIRDLNASFIPVKPGKKDASIFLQSPLGLAWRNQRGTIIGWAIGMMILGASYGSILGDVESFFSGNEMYQKLLEGIGGAGSMVEQFVVMLYAIIAMVGTVPVLQIILKLRHEEKRNRLEHILSRVVSRGKLIFSYVTLATITSLIMSFAGTFGLYSAGASVATTHLKFSTMMKASLAYLPAIWVFMSITVLLLGMFPKAIKVIWVYLGLTFATIYFGGLLQLPEWVSNLTPFGHVQKIPMEDYNIISGIVLFAISISLILIGNIKYRTRNLEG
ncbi:MAG: ABC transporter permease [Firmicutes bacterium]|nr:ABC transporter permease [Bacillota bacterium]